MNELLRIDGIKPDWPLTGVVGVMTTTRGGGVSQGNYAGLNLAAHVGDAAAAVASNRQRLLAAIECDRISWLEQVHGTNCVRTDRASAALLPRADAQWTCEPGVAIAVLTADCLPVVIAQRNGLAIAIAHAGWRGLVAGVLGATLRALPYAAADCIAWIGPAISQQVYEVGEDVATAVRQSVAFSAAAGRAAAPASNAAASGILAAGAREGKYQLDLFGLAARELAGLGIGTVYCERICTAASATLYSYRRDGVTGRMATVAWL